MARMVVRNSLGSLSGEPEQAGTTGAFNFGSPTGALMLSTQQWAQDCSVEKLLDDVNDHDVVSQCDQE